MRRFRTNDSVARDALRGAVVGAVAGIVGTLAMDLYQRLLARFTDYPQDVTQHQGEPRSKLDQDEPATVKGAAAVVRFVTGHEPSEPVRRAGGTLAHYSYGVVAGAIYGVLARRRDRRSIPRGVGYALLVWLAADEIMTPLLGIARPPWKSDARAHFLAGSAHVVYGAGIELARQSFGTVMSARH